VKLPNREFAVIEPEKLTDYLLNLNHRRGGTKARLLVRFGYSATAWQRLEADIRLYHVEADIETVRETPYGTRYQIFAALQTPTNESLFVRTVWQVDNGQTFPRLITLVPD
jgi:hypothetical protein